jgi:hypothetical protein
MLLRFEEAEDHRPWRRAMAASDSRTLEIPVDTLVLRAGLACPPRPARPSEPSGLGRRSVWSCDQNTFPSRPSHPLPPLSAGRVGADREAQ